MLLYTLTIFFVLILHQSYCADILGIFVVPSLSHQIVYSALTKELARRGHNLVVMTPNIDDDPSIPPSRYKQIDVHNLSYAPIRSTFTFALTRKGPSSTLDHYPQLRKFFIELFDTQLASPQVQDGLFKNKSLHFDLVLGECYEPASYGFAFKFKAPYIGICSTTGYVSTFEAIGNPSHPILYSDLVGVGYNTLSFYGRLVSVYNYIMVHYFDYKARKTENEVLRKYFGADVPSVQELERNVDMLFINIYPILNGMKPSVPGIVYMGGLHLKDKKPLPKDLQTFLDDSPQGVVYMSLGTNVLSKDLDKKKLTVFLEAFSRVPYKVLWKYENDELPGKPTNVKISKWLPQQNILVHPNIKVFIMQGGQQSLDEAIRNEVPLIGIPFFGDQDLNVEKIVTHGIGVGLEILTITTEELENAINNVSTDNRYKECMKKLKVMLSDQLTQPLERAVWWTEYVVRHQGARHLRARGADASLFIYFMLDIIAAGAATMLLIILMLWGIILFLCKKFRTPDESSKIIKTD